MAQLILVPVICAFVFLIICFTAPVTVPIILLVCYWKRDAIKATICSIRSDWKEFGGPEALQRYNAKLQRKVTERQRERAYQAAKLEQSKAAKSAGEEAELADWIEKRQARDET